MIWQSVRGHKEQISQLLRALERGRAAHAYVFVGPPGIGKRLVARTLAQCLFCTSADVGIGEACDECRSCKQFRAGTHPDLLEIGCPEGKRELPIELIAGPPEQRGREGLIYDLSLSPMSAARRVAIIDDADRMNAESANALLKTLEEPPLGSILLLMSSSLDALLPTIRSRCQPVHFAPLTTRDVEDLLRELGLVVEPEEAARIAALCEGSLEIAQQLLDPELRSIRDALFEQFAAADFDSCAASSRLTESIEQLGGDSAAQRRNAGWAVRFAVAFFRAALREDHSETSVAAFLNANLSACGRDPLEATERIAALLDRCLAAEGHLQQMMPVPLCFEGLCDDLGRIRRGADAKIVAATL